MRLLCCLFFVIGAISGAQPGRWELPGAAGLAGRPGAPGSAPGLPQRPLRRPDGRFNCICVHLYECSFNELYVFLIVFQDKKCTFFPLRAHTFMYECMGLMCVKACRHTLNPTLYHLDFLLNWPRYAWKCSQIWFSEGPTGSQRMQSDVTEAMRVQTLHVVSVFQFCKPLEGLNF